MENSTKKYTGWLEKPKYINGELVKAVDVVVDELIGKPFEQKDPTIALSKYNDLSEVYQQEIDAHVTTNNKYLIALSDIDNLLADVEALNQIVDSEKILTAVAENETQASNDRYASLLSNFQATVTKGVQESIARASLQGQVAGLQAQKEVLKTQYVALLAIVETLKGQISTLGDQIEQQATQAILAQEQFLANQQALQDQLTGAAASAAAAAQGLIPGQSGEFYYKLERNDGKDWSDGNTFTTSRDGYSPTKTQFAKLKVQNLKDGDGVLITQVKLIVSGELGNHGPFGFTNAKVPSKTKTVSVPEGDVSSILIYAGNQIGGTGGSRPHPNKSGIFYNASARNYRGTVQVEVRYSDGSTEKGDILNWTVRKNKKG